MRARDAWPGAGLERAWSGGWDVRPATETGEAEERPASGWRSAPPWPWPHRGSQRMASQASSPPQWRDLPRVPQADSAHDTL